MKELFAVIKALWPFISELMLAKQLKSYFMVRPLMAYSGIGLMLAFAGFLYMSMQVSTCQQIRDEDNARIAKLTGQVTALQRDNDTLRLTLKTAMYELAVEQELHRKQAK